MLSKEDIKQVLLEKRTELERFGIKRIGIFGSFVRNEQKPDSDLDIMVEYLPGQKTFQNYMQFAFFLEDTFQRKIDLVTPESISKYIYPYVKKEIEYVSLVA
ncbi:MAG: nucleotidyltransferase [Bacteroidetes bacterium]|nr:MAG: nucleotidyltransferase [Bacteroidota bacterium]